MKSDLNEFSEAQRQLIQADIDRLRSADEEALAALAADSERRRLAWFYANRDSFDFIRDDLLMSAYALLLRRFGIAPEEMAIVSRTDTALVFRSTNFCPTLEACKVLGLDTRHICRRFNERSTDLLLKQLDPRLSFSRNYEKLRPHAPFCEEMIRLENAETGDKI